LNQKRGDPVTRAATVFAHMAFCAPWRLPLMTGVLPGLREVIRTTLDAGDLPHAGYATIQMVMNLFASGMPLPQVEIENIENEQLLRRIVDGTNLDFAPPWRQLVRALRGKLVDGTTLNGEDFDEAAHLERLVATGNGSTLCFYYIARPVHRFLVGD
jgi:hypothetical protein